MSSIEIAGLVLGSFYLLTYPYSLWSKCINKLDYLSLIYRKPLNSYGQLLGSLYVTVFAEELELLDRIESRSSNEQDFASLKEVYVDDCKNTGTAAAIISSVALTALSQLPNITEVHFAAHSFFLISLVASVLSVYFGTKTLAALGNLAGSSDTRDWFTKSDMQHLDWAVESIIHDFRGGRFYRTTWRRNHARYSLKRLILDNGRRKPPLSTALLLTAPSRLLSQSAKAFLVGLGIYLGCIYTRQLNIASGAGGSLTLLVVFIIFTTWKLLLHYLPFYTKNRRNNRLARWKVLLLDVFKEENESIPINVDTDVRGFKEEMKSILQLWARDEPVSGSKRKSNARSVNDQSREGQENASTSQPTAKTAISTIMATAGPPPRGIVMPDNDIRGFESLLKAAVEAQQRSAQTLEALLLAYQSNSKTAAPAATNEAPDEQKSPPHAESTSGQGDQIDQNVSAQTGIS